MNTETVIVIGNGFDLDLGWDTSYKSFYEKHDGWKMHRRDEDDLFQYVIKQVPGNWFDFERTLHEYALHRAQNPFPTAPHTNFSSKKPTHLHFCRVTGWFSVRYRGVGFGVGKPF